MGVQVSISNHSKHTFILGWGNTYLEIHGFFFVQAFTRRSAVFFELDEVPVDNLLVVFIIGLRGEDTVPFLTKKRFRPVFKGKNIFFKFFLFIKRAKLNKEFVKKIICEKKKFRKKN